MSRTHITTRKHGDIPGQSSHWDPYGCSEAVNDWPCLSLDEVLWRTSPNCHQRQSSGEWVLCPTQAAHWDWPWWEVCGWGGRDMRWGLSWAQGHEYGRTDSAICLLWGGKGTKVRPHTHISLVITSSWESCPQSLSSGASPTPAFWRADLATHLGSTEGLTLVQRTQVSQP